MRAVHLADRRAGSQDDRRRGPIRVGHWRANPTAILAAEKKMAILQVGDTEQTAGPEPAHVL
jgi:hypothetical protein